ncbi:MULTISPECIES: DUF1127 domain-containing protein [unclassified Devosia]|uniref:DUF1127 domain-containing protein n=1 Tax=unclassified Devosia TaxID=196773 RepID=UPI0015545C48|nr:MULTISPECIES: DUF1127 domain-containing protein [unclassified Devosia]
MAHSLFSERLVAAAPAFPRPLLALRRYLAQAQVARARRHALRALLELEDCRLNDLGISRNDVLEAARTSSRSPGLALSAARARRSRR